MNVSFDIERLVVEAGDPRFDKARLKAAIERELGEVIAANRVPVGAEGRRSALARSSFGDSGETRMAREIAARIYGAMRR